MTETLSQMDARRAPPGLMEAARVWAKIGLLSFGGPAGQIALMHKELVENRRWIGEQRFLHALNYCMLLPGPEAQQLATYIGWLMHRTTGGLIAGMLFILPGALVMLGLSILYISFRDASQVGALLFGIKAAVLAIVADAVIRIARRALRNSVLVAIAAAAFASLYLFGVPFPLIILAAGVIGWAGGRIAPVLFENAGHRGSGAATGGDQGIVDLMFQRGELSHATPTLRRTGLVLAVWLPVWLCPVFFVWWLAGGTAVWTQIATFFSTMAVVTFGGAYAVLTYVAQAAVGAWGWLLPGEMVDGLGLAETTPGPLILVVQFVGFLAAWRTPGSLDPVLAGCLGGLLTTWVTFAPCFLWIFLGAPYVEALRGNKAISTAFSAITAAVVGVILNLGLWFAMHVVFGEVRTVWAGMEIPVLASIDWRAALLSTAAVVAVLAFRVGTLPTIAACAIAGLILAG